MKKTLTLFVSLFIFATLSIAQDVDFRNSSMQNNNTEYDNTTNSQDFRFDVFSSGNYTKSKKQSNLEGIFKVSAGLPTETHSKSKNSPWNLEDCSREIIYDFGFEMHYFVNKFIGIGCGLDFPFKEVETEFKSFYYANPYISFKIKNIIPDPKELESLYILFNIGTTVPFVTANIINPSYDIGVGYEYKNFVFELSYSHYNLYLKSLRYYTYDNRWASEAEVVIQRLKLSVGYKFSL